MNTTAIVFVLVYIGLLMGRLPWLSLDRTGVALLGAIALLATGDLTLAQAGEAVHVPTLALLFAFMVLSAQLRQAGFFDWVTRRVGGAALSPPLLLLPVIMAAGLLAAVFSNDIVCLAMAPVLIDACLRRRLDPVPYLLALACAANVGSALTLIGNPQNMLIAQVLTLDFAGYLLQAAPVVLAGLLITWGVLAWLYAGRWELPPGSGVAPPPAGVRLDRWQTGKGLAVASALMLAFLFSSWPLEIVALTGAGVLLLSRRLHSRQTLGLVDWQVLVLFIGLFIVNHAMQLTPMPDQAIALLADGGVDIAAPGWLFAVTVLLSNLVSNVPAVMLLLPYAEHPLAGVVLALSSTLAGNLLIVGSIANIIVVDLAARQGVVISWRTHARAGVAITLLSLLVAAGWMAWLL